MIRVLVVDDSATARDALAACLEQDGDVQVVGAVADGAAAVAAVAALSPDAVTMDIQMPGGGGLAAIEQIMARNPVPILVVTVLARVDRELPFEALSRGALEVVLKPSTPAEGAALRAAVRRIAGLPVVPHVRGLRTARAAVRRPRTPTQGRGRPRVVGIAASTGGPAALEVVLGALPASLPACVALVQHLPASFVASFADYLRTRTALDVVLVQPGPGIPARPGRLAIAAAEHHLVALSPRLLGASPDPPLRGHRPSATVLFRSLARFIGDRAVGVILTGIGDDGVDGLLELHARGAVTLAQDQQTSMVYGMPRAAAARGAVTHVLPLSEIAAAIRQAVGAPEVAR